MEIGTELKQFPIRIDRNLSDALDYMSAETHITKTAISRLAIKKFLLEMERNGAIATMERLKRV